MSEGDRGKGTTSRSRKAIVRFLPWEVADPLFRMQLRSKGMLVMAAVAAATLAIWAAQGSSSLQNAVTVLAKTSAFLAISLLSVSFVMSTRLPVLEDLFGGLDRQYKVHTVVGKITLFAVLFHVLFLTLRAVPSWDTVLGYLVPGLNVPVSWGILSLLALFVLLALTVHIRIPYGVWHQTHRLMVVPLLLAVWHSIDAGSDIQRYPVLMYWVVLVAAVGVASYLYTLVLYRYVGPKHPATVTGVRRFPQLTEVRVRPHRGSVRFHPGQFMFLRFPRFKGVPEMWPFSISSWPPEEELRFSIKKLGDFTSGRAPLIEEGDAIVLMGPYGKFGDRFVGDRRDMIWIAGGIGITPFLSMARYEAEKDRGRQVDLVWAFRHPGEGIYRDELAAEGSERFRFVPWVSGEQGRLDAEKVAELVGGMEAVRERVIFLCGPVPMMESLAKQFAARGVRMRDIVFEDFDLL